MPVKYKTTRVRRVRRTKNALPVRGMVKEYVVPVVAKRMPTVTVPTRVRIPTSIETRVIPPPVTQSIGVNSMMRGEGFVGDAWDWTKKKLQQGKYISRGLRSLAPVVDGYVPGSSSLVHSGANWVDSKGYGRRR